MLQNSPNDRSVCCRRWWSPLDWSVYQWSSNPNLQSVCPSVILLCGFTVRFCTVSDFTPSDFTYFSNYRTLLPTPRRGEGAIWGVGARGHAVGCRHWPVCASTLTVNSNIRLVTYMTSCWYYYCEYPRLPTRDITIRRGKWRYPITTCQTFSPRAGEPLARIGKDVIGVVRCDNPQNLGYNWSQQIV